MRYFHYPITDLVSEAFRVQARRQDVNIVTGCICFTLLSITDSSKSTTNKIDISYAMNASIVPWLSFSATTRLKRQWTVQTAFQLYKARLKSLNIS
jgi:hypothetical protein